MRSARDRFLLMALLATSPGCEPAVERAASNQSSAADSANPMHIADPELMSACDSVEQLLRAAVTWPLERTNGQFDGTARGARRWGCRLATADTLLPELPQRPLDTVWPTLAARGWQLEPDYIADSSDGAMLGMRLGTMLCVLQHFWESHSDDERATQPSTPYRYDIVVECFREAPR